MKIAYIVAVATTLAACDFRSGGSHRPGDPTADGGAAADGATSGTIDASAGSGPADGGDPAACGQDPAPTGPDDPCPRPCDTCAGGVCTVDCGQSNCNDTVACPAGYECVVLCSESDACDGSGVTCPPDHACSVVCSGGSDACGDFQLMCGAGSCSIECAGDDTCDGAVVHCGDGACTGSCTPDNPATVECGDACDCTEC